MGGLLNMLNVINTFDGSQALKNNCRRIKGEYFEVNRQCFLMPDGKWHRINNGRIAFDHEVGKWVLISESPDLTEGIVDIKYNSDGTLDLKKGYFTRTLKNTLLTTMENKYNVISFELVDRVKDIVESPGDGYFYTREFVKTHPSVMTKRVKSYPFSLPYSASYFIGEYVNAFNKLLPEEWVTAPPKNRFFEEISDIKFGFEFETWNGTIPVRKLKPAGLMPLRDGSLQHGRVRSYEYATIPLQGLVGLRALENICNLLQDYTEISPYCSTHIHISGYKPTKKFIVNLYLTVKRLENEIYSLFPSGFEDTSTFKSKNYCGRFPNLSIKKKDTTESAFDKVYSWLVGGEDRVERYPFEGFGTHNHPSDPGDHSKWSIEAR